MEHSSKFSHLGLLSIIVGLFMVGNVLSDTIAGSYFISITLASLIFTGISLGKNGKINLIIFTVVFMLGVVFSITRNYEILSPSNLYFPVILFMLGAIFVMLFIDDFEEKIFLLNGGVLFICGFLSVLFKGSNIVKLGNSLINRVLDAWPILLLIFLLGAIFNRKK